MDVFCDDDMAIAWTNAKIVNDYLSYYNLIFLRFLLGFLSLLICLYLKTFSKIIRTQIYNSTKFFISSL